MDSPIAQVAPAEPEGLSDAAPLSPGAAERDGIFGRTMRVDLGLGPRLVPSLLDGNQWGAQLSGRLIYLEQWAVDFGATVRIPPTSEDLAGHADVALARADEDGVFDFTYPIEREIAAVHLRTELAPWRRPSGDTLGIFVALVLGAELKVVRTDVATVLDGLAIGEVTAHAGPTAGISTELWFNPRFGLRGAWIERVWSQRARTYEEGGVGRRQIVLSPGFALDLRVRL